MKVLAIIPTLGKRPEMLAEAVASIKAQTRQPDVFKVVTEGENTWEKINKAVKENPDCEAFFALSDDDLIDPTFIEKTTALMEKWNTDLIYTSLENFGEETGVHGAGRLPFMTTLTSRRIWEKVGGYDERAGIAADSDFWISCLEAEARIERIGEPLFKYRKHSGQWSYGGNWKESMDWVMAKHPNWKFT